MSTLYEITHPKGRPSNPAMLKTFEKGAARASLFLGDCREILPTLPPADYCVITDPPWPRYHPDTHGIEVDEERFREAVRALDEACRNITLF